MSRDFELGWKFHDILVWLTGGVDRQSHTGLIFVVQLQGGKVDPNFENKKNFPEKKLNSFHYDQKKYAESIGEVRS